MTTLEHLADLAALELEEDESKRLLSELETILQYVKRVQTFECPEETVQPKSRFRRPDTIVNTPNSSLFALAPDLKDELFCTPVVAKSLANRTPPDES